MDRRAWLRVATWALTLLIAGASIVPSTLRPPSRTPSDGEYLCADHVCGCSSAEDCANGCCCFPIEPSTESCCSEPEPAPSGLPTIEVLRCTGGLGPALLAPMLFLVGVPDEEPCERISDGELSEVSPLRPTCRRPAPQPPPPRRNVV